MCNKSKVLVKIIFKMTIFIIILGFSIDVNALEKNGWITENGKTYYYENGILKQWWQQDENGIFYLQADGSVKQGLQTINGIIYYVENNYIYKGEKIINGQLYIFNEKNGEMKYGSIRLPDGNLIYVEKNGKHYKDGWIESNGFKYYQKDYYILEGFQIIGAKTYYFEPDTGKLKQWWQQDENGIFYLQADGSVKQGLQTINGIIYYVENNYIYKGEKIINGQLYIFNEKNGEMKYGSIRLPDGNLYYIEKNGTRYKDGWIKSNGNKYYQKDNYLVEGFQTINNKTYYFEPNTGKLKQWWQQDKNGIFYLQADGSVKQGLQTINGIIYYVENNYIYKGEKVIDNQIFAFNEKNGEMKYGSVRLSDGNLMYIEKNGTRYKDGWIKSNGNKYYQKDNYLVEGFQTINNKTYYFEPNTGKLKQWWQQDENGIFYLQADGSVKQGLQTINGIVYYIENNYIYKGEKVIDNEFYSFNNNGELITGVYRDSNNNIRYSTKNGKHPSGWVMYNDNVYYINNDKFVITGEHTIDGEHCVFDEEGKYIKVQTLPVYYKQTDSRWANVKYGSRTMKATGCAPTSMAMAFSAIKNTEILPTDVANFLYRNTNEYNRYTIGSSGLAIVYATEYYDIKRYPITTVEEMKVALARGKIVFAAMGNGKFATKDWNHAIILNNYDKGYTFALDPLKDSNNGWVSIDTIISEQSKDPDDSRGGSNFYMLW